MATRTSTTNVQAMTDTFELEDSNFVAIQDSDFTPLYIKGPFAVTNQTWTPTP